jgi:hypothetical protein
MSTSKKLQEEMERNEEAEDMGSDSEPMESTAEI